MLKEYVVKVFFLGTIAVTLSGCATVPVVNLFLAPPKDVVYKDTKPCVPGDLKRVLNHTSRKFGRVTVVSTKRGAEENRRKGGAENSYHLRCEAVDFHVAAKPKKVIKHLKSYSAVGGYKAYFSHYHIDTGPRRTW
ncbi:MAG: D-Ala-D-Ala carboxypeptidase family metallohydrolase [Pseudomonadota bacterium]